MKIDIGRTLACAVAVLFAGAGSSFAERPSDTVDLTQKQARSVLLSSQAKIGLEQAEQIAQKKVPGVTKEIQLDRAENGNLIYSVEIAHADKEFEVKVDAMSGEILTVKGEDGNEISQSKKGER